MSDKDIVLYLHVHQPYRLRPYSVLDAGKDHNYFEASIDHASNNYKLLQKVANKSYLPTNQKLLKLLREHSAFKFSLSITGTILEQLEAWAPEVLESFQKLTATGRVEIVAETYYHSLAFFYSREEFENQIAMHRQKVEALFGQTPKVIRNTELAYNNDFAHWADKAGYKGVLTEGWDPILGWRSPNFVYRPSYTQNVRLLMKNYKLSDDIAFRFGDRDWKEWPLTADKFAHWLSETGNATNFNLFMDYETFGEHQWEDKGIFDFLDHLPKQWLKDQGHGFATVSEVIDKNEAVDHVDVPQTITWADTERDLTAWLGNPMQQQAIASLYALERAVLGTGDNDLINDWRKLQTSDHFYYMCTKWFADGDVHAYFSPYESPYEAFIYFINAYHDLKYRLSRLGVTV